MTSPTPCISDERLRDFISERITGSAANDVAAHLAECEECAEFCNQLTDDSQVRRAFQLSRSPSDAEESDSPALKSLRRQLYRQHADGGSMPQDADPFIKPVGLAAGTRVSHFEVEKLLDSGGFAHVYLARDVHLDRKVALKIPHSAVHFRPEIRQRQLAEGNAAARLHHPNIVTVFEVGETDANVYIAADYCSGPTLAEWYASQPGAVPGILAAQIVLRLVNAIEHAHLNGLIHRDIKPANVLLDPDQPDTDLPFSPKLTDFGLAKLVDADMTQTASGILKGTPGYMAPEQAQGLSRDVGPECDIYALGVILYELLTGRRPIEGDTQVDTLRRLVSEEPAPLRRFVPSVPRDLEAITLKCLEKSPDRRYATARELQDDLERFLGGTPTLARPLNPIQRCDRWCRKNPAVAGAMMMTLLVLSISSVAMWLNSKRLTRQNEQLESMTQSQAQLLYAADIQIASRAIRDGDFRQADKLLDRYIPDAEQPDLRDFEWGLLRRTRNPIEIVLADHEGDVYMARYSPDGRYLASAGQDGTVRLYETSHYRPLFTLEVGAGEVNGVDFSPDSQSIAAAGDDGGVYVFDISTQRQRLKIPAHEGMAFQAIFTPDGTTLFTCGNDACLKRWTADIGVFLGELGTHEERVERIAISDCGQYVASASKVGGFVWEIDTGRMVHQHAPPARFNDVSFSRSGWISWALWDAQCLLERIDETGQVHSAATDTAIHDPVQSVGLSPDSRWQASGDRGGVIRLRSIQADSDPRPVTGGVADGGSLEAISNEQPRSWRAHNGRVWSIDFSTDNHQIVSAGTDGTVRVWSIGSDRLLETGTHRLSNERGFVDCAFLDDGRLATTSPGLVSVWDLNGISPVRNDVEEGVGSDWSRIAVAPPTNANGPLLILGSHSGNVQIRDVRSGDVVSEWSDDQQRDVRWLKASSEGSRLFLLMHGDLLILQLPNLQKDSTIPDVRSNALAVSPQGRWLAVAGRGEDSIGLWDLRAFRPVRIMQGHSRSVTSLTFRAFPSDV